MAVTIHQAHHRVDAIAAPRQSGDIPVIGPLRFQRQPYEFPATLYAGPVIQFVTHVFPPVSKPNMNPADWPYAISGNR
jgi:hypothetical protein